MEEEIWKDVVGFEGLYRISNHGRVMSVPRKNARGQIIDGRILKPAINCSGMGYPQVGLRKDGKTHYVQIHRIVARAFLGTPPDGYEVDHIDKVHTNNKLSNLRYLTIRKNRGRTVIEGDVTPPRLLLADNPKSKKVVGYEDGRIVDEVDCAKYLTIRYGINYSSVRYYLQHGGLKIKQTLYKYADTN